MRKVPIFLVALTLALGGCDKIIGIEGTQLGATDAALSDGPSVDATPTAPAIVTVNNPDFVGYDQTISFTVEVSGTPEGMLSFTISPGDGTFTVVTGSVHLDSTGAGAITLEYQAPGVDGVSMHAIEITDPAQSLSDSANFSTTTASLVYGRVTAQGGSSEWASGTLLSQRITLDHPATVQRLGTHTTAAGTNIKLALYTVADGDQGSLLAETGPVATMAGGGKVEADVLTPVAIEAGNYFVACVGDGQVAVVSNGINGTGYAPYTSHSYSLSMPDPFGTPNTNAEDPILNLHMVVSFE